MKIATNSQILNTLNLLQARSKKVIDRFNNSLKEAEFNGTLSNAFARLSHNDMVELHSAYQSFNTFELAKANYR